MPDTTVTVTDADGTTETKTLDPEGYVLVCGSNMDLRSEHRYRNGTVQLTLKPKDSTSR